MDKDTRYFDKLDVNAPLFRLLKEENPHWWTLLKERASKVTPLEERIYINIRKDNSLDVYYQGGLLVSISFKIGKTEEDNQLVFHTHYKYLSETDEASYDDVKDECYDEAGPKPDKKQKLYLDVNINDVVGKQYDAIKSRIKKNYSEKSKSYSSEKSIQSRLYSTGNFIDTEFAYNGFVFVDDGKTITKDIRIDLLRYDKDQNRLTFVELKREADNRLLCAVDKTTGKRPDPEILSQMKAYKAFVTSKIEYLIRYYRTLLRLGQEIGIIDKDIESETLSFNPDVELFIVQEGTPSKRRMERDEAIRAILDEHGIKYTWMTL